MVKIFVILTFIFIQSTAKASELKTFISDCGYGMLIGAGVGVLSLAFEKNPSDHTNNVARGASLGLYGGIAYGIIRINEQPVVHEVKIVSPSVVSVAQAETIQYSRDLLTGLFYKYNF